MENMSDMMTEKRLLQHRQRIERIREDVRCREEQEAAVREDKPLKRSEKEKSSAVICLHFGRIRLQS